MARAKLSSLEQVTSESCENTLAKRVLNSNLSDEDKIDLIQLIGSRPNIISIPSVWTPNIQPSNPIYREHGTDLPKTPPNYVITCTLGNDACPHANVSCDEE